MSSQSDSEKADGLSAPEKIVMGVISGAYGIKGWVRVYSSTDPIENILKYKSWYLKKKNQETEVKLSNGRTHGKGIVAKFEGYDDRNAAESLIKAEILVPADELPDLRQGEYYWRDLIGLKVQNVSGTSYGIIDHMMPTVANDVIVVKDGDHERLIPFAQGVYVIEIDLENGLMVVDWPEDF